MPPVPPSKGVDSETWRKREPIDVEDDSTTRVPHARVPDIEAQARRNAAESDADRSDGHPPVIDEEDRRRERRELPKPERIEPGTIVGGYRLEALLGKGGMGSVFSARSIDGGPRVAIKILAIELLNDPTAVPRFMREAKLASKLESPHAVRVLAFDTLPSGVPYIVMELLDGEPLFNAVKGQKLPELEALDLIAQACEAVGEAHAVGVVHRDLKLGNLFLTTHEDGSHFLKVLDFGLAKPQYKPDEQPTSASLTQAGAFLGTPQYMAPEQILSARDIDARVDVWALGVCLYKLVTNEYPFDGEDATLTVAKVLGGHPTPPRTLRPDLSKETSDLIMRCLSTSPISRFQNGRELGEALRRILTPPKRPDERQETESDRAITVMRDPRTFGAVPYGMERTKILRSNAPPPPPHAGSVPPPPRSSFASMHPPPHPSSHPVARQELGRDMPYATGRHDPAIGTAVVGGAAPRKLPVAWIVMVVALVVTILVVVALAVTHRLPVFHAG